VCSLWWKNWDRFSCDYLSFLISVLVRKILHTFPFIVDLTQSQRLVALLVVLERPFEMAVLFDPTNIAHLEKIHP
jgi:hypothetical protein